MSNVGWIGFRFRLFIYQFLFLILKILSMWFFISSLNKFSSHYLLIALIHMESLSAPFECPIAHRDTHIHKKIFICKHIKYNGLALILLYLLWGPFLHHLLVLGLWAGNAKLFNVNKFYYCYSCVCPLFLASAVFLFLYLSQSSLSVWFLVAASWLQCNCILYTIFYCISF